MKLVRIVVYEITREVFEWYFHKPVPKRGVNLDEYMDDILDILSPPDGPPLTKDRIVNIRQVYPIHNEGTIQVAIKI